MKINVDIVTTMTDDDVRKAFVDAMTELEMRYAFGIGWQRSQDFSADRQASIQEALAYWKSGLTRGAALMTRDDCIRDLENEDDINFWIWDGGQIVNPTPSYLVTLTREVRVFANSDEEAIEQALRLIDPTEMQVQAKRE